MYVCSHNQTKIKNSMGKGDKKSRKGKIAMGSYGVTRPKKKSNSAASAAKSTSAKKVAAPKREAAPKKVVAAKPARAAAKKAPSKKAE
jgi:30S ribosomal protein S31